MPLTVKPALEKLPLATRKDVRDNWENKKPEFEKEISELLGTPYTIEINVNECLAYSERTDNGAAFTGYLNSFLERLKAYLKTHNDEGKRYFNEAVTKSKISVAVEPTGDKSDTTGKVVDGVYFIHFPYNYFGSWQSMRDEHFLLSIDEVERADKELPLIVKKSIRDQYDVEINTIKTSLAAITGIPELELIIDPNFAGNYTYLKSKGSKVSSGWEGNLGSGVLNYLKGLEGQLKKQGFAGDDMLQEGLQEAMDKKTILVRAVDEMPQKTSYNEAYFKDGVLYLETLPDQWNSWTSSAGEKLIDQL